MEFYKYSTINDIPTVVSARIISFYVGEDAKRESARDRGARPGTRIENIERGRESVGGIRSLLLRLGFVQGKKLVRKPLSRINGRGWMWSHLRSEKTGRLRGQLSPRGV